MNTPAKIHQDDWIRSKVDVEKARKAIQAARRALFHEGGEASRRELVFWLLKDAARTERAMKGPGPRGHVSCMPEVYHTAGEIFATEVAMVSEGISYPPQIREVITAEAAGRYLEVTKWLRFVRGKTKERGKTALWLMAKGVPPFYIARETGYPEGPAQRGAKYRLCGQIVDRLERENVFA